MNAHALLTSQGWRGMGHSLHKTDDDIGLAKPLVLLRKNDKKGLGTKQHYTSDLWWMKAFDEQLRGLDTSQDGKVVQTVTTGGLNLIEQSSLGKYSLFTSFVRGDPIQGTVAEQQADTSSSTDPDDESLLPSTEQAPPPTETKEEKRARRAERRRRKEERAKKRALRCERRLKAIKPADSSNNDADEKEERRARRAEGRRRKEERAMKRTLRRERRLKAIKPADSSNNDADEKRRRRAKREERRRKREVREAKKSKERVKKKN
ncbi:hypothetical protein G6O67_002154 [Ophiocordyceps sinensis]|uniref:G-patch domain-containing protein n=2 Tax=Ophiocordyceps sinensis TaxID=72228 RepID=A0A8H4PTL1_9HYPO|nr:DNA-directed RNA polymerase II subunit RPB1 [Ophiocordyceps sinensis CO18]KAF4510251.1 hypothetical protein G6O67_002154 [Ophiocordyceps sinensis]